MGIDIEGKDAVVLGRSYAVGVPVAMLLMQRNATVTICHSSTRSLDKAMRRADIVVSAVGRPGVVHGSMLKRDAVVIDLGTSPIEDADSPGNFKTVGDCDHDSCAQVASFITSPILGGGLGVLSFALMLRNTLNASFAGHFDQAGNTSSRRGSRRSITIAPRETLNELENDPYLKYGGCYEGDPKDTEDFKYVSFPELPRFTPAHKSAMSRHLTADVFARLKDVKSDRGYTLSNAIMTGVVTPHLGVGATAGDENCWEVFKPLFYPIIKDWHGYDAETQTHPMDLDPSKLSFTAEQRATFGEYVVSTRIRAARNISGFSLPSGATSADRAGVESVLRQAFAGLSGELSGTYYELGGLTTEQRDFLLEKGFLFQIPSARNLLTGAGAARSWPDNRGIFHNEAQTALAWVNEEDHCRIISMEMGGDIPSVFSRFCALSEALKASAEANGTQLMWNERLGFLGTCPSNLGTGLRASVMIRLPEFNKLLESGDSEDKDLLEQVCSAFDLQPRGSAGEHSAAVGAKFDVSNKQRLGFSEVELVQKMIDGVSRVIVFEKMLASGSSPATIRQIFSGK
jgi:creatine kinase